MERAEEKALATDHRDSSTYDSLKYYLYYTSIFFPFLRFGVIFVHANLCLHTFTTCSLGCRGGGGRGLFEIFFSS